MKTFNDLKPGDYVYMLDLLSGIIEEIKITQVQFHKSDIIIFSTEEYNNRFWFYKDKSVEIYSDNMVKYIADKDMVSFELDKLIKNCKVIIKTAKQNIQKIKEL
jgi:hypothetical protein